jgi:hypothetical protein
MTKKILTLILIGIMITSIVALAEEDIDQNQQAEELKELGLFKGSDKGFELERPPKRIEAAVMLVRLLGKESEVLENEYSHPFTDVPAWADKYIGYMYENGLTKGISESEFGSDNLTDLKSYSTFVLRTLGYDDSAGDFSWNGAADKAQEAGILSEEKLEEMKNNSFLRGNMVEVSYNALKTNIKGSSELLIDDLIDMGVVDRSKAESLNIGKNEENSELNYIDLTITKKNGGFKAELDRDRLPEDVKEFSNITNNASNTYKEKEDIKFIYLMLDKTKNFPPSSIKREKIDFSLTSYEGNFTYIGLYENNQLKGMMQIEYPEDEGIIQVPIYVWNEEDYSKYTDEIMRKIDYTLEDAEYIESDKFEVIYVEKDDKYIIVDTEGLLKNKNIMYFSSSSALTNSTFDPIELIRDSIKRQFVYNGELNLQKAYEVYNEYLMSVDIYYSLDKYSIFYFVDNEKKVAAYTYITDPKADSNTYNQIKLTLSFQDEYDSYTFNNEEIEMDVFADGEKILEVKGEYVYDMNGNKIDNYAFEKIVQNEDYTVDLYYFYIYPHAKDITVTVDTSYEYKVDVLD